MQAINQSIKHVLNRHFHSRLLIQNFCSFFPANLAYRLLRNEKKVRIKIIHAGMQFLAFIFMVIALRAGEIALLNVVCKCK